MHQEQKKSELENFTNFQESILDTTVDISEQISKGEYHEITPTVISFILSIFEILFEEHPKWFKSADEQDKAIKFVEKLSKCFSLIKDAFGDKPRELTSWKSLFGYSELGKLMKKRVALLSAIFGLAFTIPTPNTVINAWLVILIICLIVIKIVLFISNDGHILIEAYKEEIFRKELSLYEYLAIIVYVSMKVPFEPEKKHKDYGNVIYEYEFVRELNNPKNYNAHRKKVKNFHCRRL